MIRTELKRGTAELAVLSVLEEGPLHGYEIGRRIEAQSAGALRFTLAALYPLLYRMEHRGWLRGEWETGISGKRRRCYRLLPRGRKMLSRCAANRPIYFARCGGWQGDPCVIGRNSFRSGSVSCGSRDGGREEKWQANWPDIWKNNTRRCF